MSEYRRVNMVQIQNKIIIADGESPLRYLDLETNKVHVYPGQMRFQWWYRKPKWYQFRLKRKYRNVLTTKNNS